MIFKSLSILSLSLLSIVAQALNPPDSSATLDSISPLEDVAYAAELDSIIKCYYEDLISLSEPIYSLQELSVSDSMPVFSSEVYAERLSVIDQRTPFDLSYNNTVEAFIHLYMSKKRSLSSNSLGRSQLYFSQFEAALDRNNLPLELKYLAVVESGLNPKAKSRAGATGLWQFMYRTGKHFGLEVNSYVDERCDPEKSTEAACQYLGYLYNLFDDWNLALAAYNCGEGRVASAIRRSGGKRDYWEIYPYLPRETRGYVPAFIAVNYLFAYAGEHNIKASNIQHRDYEIDSVHLRQPVTFSQVAEILNLDVETISTLNPVYRMEVIPAYDNHRTMYLPKEKINLWVANQDSIENTLKSLKAQDQVKAVPEQKPTTYYTVRSGDYLGKIANRYGCSVRQIQDWNNMRSTSLRVGQRLTLYSNEVVSFKPKPRAQPVITQSGNNVYYTIRSGDTLWDIAEARGVGLESLKSMNPGVSSNRMKPGQKIIVSKK
jgi:membrane-bound lytic murein transglycosylase D